MVRRFLMGNEAFAHAALEAGCGVFAGYPGTPSSEVIETVARLHADGAAEGIHVEWSTNEKAALEVAAAASLSGARAMVTCKQVGLNVASDALMSLNYVGVKGGLVILVADDPGPISSQTEQDTRRFAAFAKVPVFDPATPEQGAAMIPHAFAMSERYRTPVIIRPTTRIDHASTFLDVAERTAPRSALGGGFHRDPAEYVIFPPRAYQAHGEINERLNAIAHDLMFDPDLIEFNPLFENTLPHAGSAPSSGKRASLRTDHDRERALAPAKVGIVTGGVSTQYAREAIRTLDRLAARAGWRLPPLRLLQIGTPYPFPKRVAARSLKDLTDVLVLEELDSVIEEELQKMANASFLWPRVHGKLSGEANTRGENSTEDAIKRIAAFLDAYANGEDIQEPLPQDPERGTFAGLAHTFLNPKSHYEFPGSLPARPAVLCAGCPHRASFLTVKRALKQLGVKRDDAVFAGDIGCYTLGNAAPLDAVDTCLCMGGGITMAQGIAVANEGKKAIAFVGDSTFFASGMTGIVNAAYNGHDVTICVLDNSTTAMTGLQPHPGTGATLMGEQRAPVNIKAVLKASNITKIVEANPLDGAAAEEAAVEAIEFEGPSAIIFKSPCVWTKPFGIPAKVNASKCTGCKKCVTQIGCPAIGFEVNARGSKSGKRGQAVIDRTQCNGCGICLPVCPFDAIDQTPELEPQPVKQSRLNRGGSSSAARGDAAPADETERGVERVADIGEPVEGRASREKADFAAEDAAALSSSALTRAYADAARGGSAGPGGLASERLSGIRNQAPIIPMNPYGSLDDFEDDDLYDEMTARRPRRDEARRAKDVKRVIKPAGERRYFMKDAIQRSAAAVVFAYTPSGEASQAAQIALTRSPQSAAVQPVTVREGAKRDAGSQDGGNGYVAPDYGGNSELSLDALFSSSPEVSMDDPDEGAHEGAQEGAKASARAAEGVDGDIPEGDAFAEHPEEGIDELDISFDGLQMDLDDPARSAHRSHGRSSERSMRRVRSGEGDGHDAGDAMEADGEDARGHADGQAQRKPEAPQVAGPQGSLIPQSKPQRPARTAQRSTAVPRPGSPSVSQGPARSVRSRFADYGQSGASGAGGPGTGGGAGASTGAPRGTQDPRGGSGS